VPRIILKYVEKKEMLRYELLLNESGEDLLTWAMTKLRVP
jgi:succinate dehydrogenase flavin-adding protein (antitoxin of CptAB toxin-antitoxin module)